MASGRAEQLTALARSRAPDDRERLGLALADLCSDEQAATDPTVQVLLQDIFLSIVTSAEQHIRRRLSERLAEAPWAPKSLITVLALDDIEIARPVIASSPVLQEHDLLRLLVEATVEHQIEVARRPNIGPPVVSAILDQARPEVLTALAGNETAEVGSLAMARLLEASRRVVAMRAPLARHPRLTSELAERLYEWVGDTIRQSLTQRFKVDPAALGRAVSESVREAHTAPEDEPRAHAAGRDADREEMERRLIAKLSAAGQLRPGYLLRALEERKLRLFELAAAELTGVPPADLRRAVESDRPELLAYVCVAVGVDRSVFPSLVRSLRELTGGTPRSGPETAKRVEAAFRLRDGEAARVCFRGALAGLQPYVV